MPEPTKQDYEEHLNELPTDQLPTKVSKYGTWMRRTDPVQFDVGYQEYCRTHRR